MSSASLSVGSASSALDLNTKRAGFAKTPEGDLVMDEHAPDVKLAQEEDEAMSESTGDPEVEEILEGERPVWQRVPLVDSEGRPTPQFDTALREIFRHFGLQGRREHYWNPQCYRRFARKCRVQRKELTDERIQLYSPVVPFRMGVDGFLKMYRDAIIDGGEEAVRRDLVKLGYRIDLRPRQRRADPAALLDEKRRPTVVFDRMLKEVFARFAEQDGSHWTQDGFNKFLSACGQNRRTTEATVQKMFQEYNSVFLSQEKLITESHFVFYWASVAQGHPGFLWKVLEGLGVDPLTGRRETNGGSDEESSEGDRGMFDVSDEEELAKLRAPLLREVEGEDAVEACLPTEKFESVLLEIFDRYCTETGVLRIKDFQTIQRDVGSAIMPEGVLRTLFGTYDRRFDTLLTAENFVKAICKTVDEGQPVRPGWKDHVASSSLLGDVGTA